MAMVYRMASASRAEEPLHAVERAPKAVIASSARGMPMCQPRLCFEHGATNRGSRYNTQNGISRASVLFTGMLPMVQIGVRVEGSTGPGSQGQPEQPLFTQPAW